MAMKEIYDKNSETVIENTKAVREQFVNDIQRFADEAGINTTELTLLIGGGPALTNRMKNSNENMTIKTMSRFAAAVGKKIKIDFVDLDA